MDLPKTEILKLERGRNSQFLRHLKTRVVKFNMHTPHESEQYFFMGKVIDVGDQFVFFIDEEDGRLRNLNLDYVEDMDFMREGDEDDSDSPFYVSKREGGEDWEDVEVQLIGPATVKKPVPSKTSKPVKKRKKKGES